MINQEDIFFEGPDSILETINPLPQIGDIWRFIQENNIEQYYLILDIDEGPQYRNATILNLHDSNVVEDYLDTYHMTKYSCWRRVG